MRSAARGAENTGIVGNVAITIFPIHKNRAIAVFS